MGKLELTKTYSQQFDKSSLCNIVSVEPNEIFPSRRVYIDISRYLTHTAK